MAYQYITNIDSPNYTPNASVPAIYGMPRVIEGICVHHWGDPNTWLAGHLVLEL